ncbi:hypothetical protein BT96DRAFT_917878 [Gymnopus androsaceus JB14]|uniref:Arrestin-like N-terminal domain-containing protein n=1 Tax=Gymnopus androsaceus JB14 TaxID=1447944 RepID=A0A6A4HUN9_9AGAR|nr:hypothetical protein BT96DRAFT_917878 [Gymnopus androsaceus JB14]
MKTLPPYSARSSPPSYSARPNDGEEVLAAAHTVYQTPTGSFTARCHRDNVTVTMQEQNEGIETPVYHQQGLIYGTIAHKNKAENVLLRVTLKIEGKLKLSVFGRNSASSTVKVLDESYELWTKTRDAPSCPETLEFSFMLPLTFRQGVKEFPLPPSHEISLTGFLACSYTLKVVRLIRGPLWNINKSFSIRFKYLPRRWRSSEPPTSLDRCCNRGGCMLYYETIKTSPEAWSEKIAVLRVRNSSGIAPVEVQFFIPSKQTFELADKIPFHIQLTGSEPSLQALSSHLRLKHVANNKSDIRPETFSPDFFTAPAPPASQLPPPDSNNVISLSVTLRRQVCVEVKGQVVFKNCVIGEGQVYPLPPAFESVTESENPAVSSSLSGCIEPMRFVDGAGDIKCSPEVEIGNFNAGKVKVDHFLVLQIEPIRDQFRSPFFPLQIAAPVSLVYS